MLTYSFNNQLLYFTAISPPITAIFSELSPNITELLSSSDILGVTLGVTLRDILSVTMHGNLLIPH